MWNTLTPSSAFIVVWSGAGVLGLGTSGDSVKSVTGMCVVLTARREETTSGKKE